MLGRSEYWLRVIGSTIGLMVLFIMSMVVFEGSVLLLVLTMIVTVVVSIAQIVWSVQRFHDVGLSGVWLLLSLVPFVGGLAVLIVHCLPTDTFDTYDNGQTGRV